MAWLKPPEVLCAASQRAARAEPDEVPPALREQAVEELVQAAGQLAG